MEALGFFRAVIFFPGLLFFEREKRFKEQSFPPLEI
jgi:hypothetical protein